LIEGQWAWLTEQREERLDAGDFEANAPDVILVDGEEMLARPNVQKNLWRLPPWHWTEEELRTMGCPCSP